MDNVEPWAEFIFKYKTFGENLISLDLTIDLLQALGIAPKTSRVLGSPKRLLNLPMDKIVEKRKAESMGDEVALREENKRLKVMRSTSQLKFSASLIVCNVKESDLMIQPGVRLPNNSTGHL
jgi:hypothetical protein